MYYKHIALSYTLLENVKFIIVINIIRNLNFFLFFFTFFYEFGNFAVCDFFQEINLF
jgi:hypothetical protein